MGFTRVSCTNLSPRRRMRCAGEGERLMSLSFLFSLELSRSCDLEPALPRAVRLDLDLHAPRLRRQRPWLRRPRSQHRGASPRGAISPRPASSAASLAPPVHSPRDPGDTRPRGVCAARRDRSESVPRDIDLTRPHEGCAARVHRARSSERADELRGGEASHRAVLLHRSLASDVRPPQRRNDSERRSEGPAFAAGPGEDRHPRMRALARIVRLAPFPSRARLMRAGDGARDRRGVIPARLRRNPAPDLRMFSFFHKHR